MNRISMRKKSLTEYQVVIFDLDGTLYFQKPFRVRMMSYLLGYILAHPSALRDVLIVKKYRKVREEWEYYEDADGSLSLDERQYACVAKKMGVTSENVENAVKFFMLEAPLKFLPHYRDEMLADRIAKLCKSGVKVVIYSDYPVEDKLRALKISADACYTSSDSRIGCMKPNPKGIKIILKDIGCRSEDALMIGDRYEKDGLAAKGNDVDYIILDKKDRERRKAWLSFS